MMRGFIRWFGGGPLFALFLGAVGSGSAIWQLQAWRYTGQIHHLKADRLADQAQLATARAALIEAQAKIVTRVEVRYRDRIRVVKEKGQSILQKVPIYVTPQDNARFGVPAGFVHLFNAAFSGTPATPATQSDRQPVALSIATLAEATAFNAAVCRQWQAQALGWQDFYRQLQKTHGAVETPSVSSGITEWTMHREQRRCVKRP